MRKKRSSETVWGPFGESGLRLPIERSTRERKRSDRRAFRFDATRREDGRREDGRRERKEGGRAAGEGGRREEREGEEGGRGGETEERGSISLVGFDGRSPATRAVVPRRRPPRRHGDEAVVPRRREARRRGDGDCVKANMCERDYGMFPRATAIPRPPAARRGVGTRADKAPRASPGGRGEGEGGRGGRASERRCEGGRASERRRAGPWAAAS